MRADFSPANPRWIAHSAALAAIAFLVGLLFLQPTRMGDDFTYWSFAFDLHERGMRAWQLHSFHDLRWPVWGLCWLLQGLFGPGLISFYAPPLLYLAAGAVVAFWIGKLVTNSLTCAWISGVAFLFHPLLDTVCYRPMPDLSEGVWGAAAMLCWWRLVGSENRARSWLWAMLTGACIYIGESNRVTGAFIVPVLLICTLVYARPRFGWLVLAGTFAAVFYTLECAFYHQLFGDWLHNIHANLGNKSSPGTHPISVWSLPFRFLDTLWKGNPLAPVYCILATVGIWRWWRIRKAREPLGATAMPMGVIVIWFVVLYLEYGCAPQSLWPWRPLVRDADRFLCGLVVPMSVLAAIGLCEAHRFAKYRPIGWCARHPVAAGSIGIVLLAAITSREFFDLNFAVPMRNYLRTLPAGTKVFTHDSMRALAFLVAPDSAKSFTWRAPEKILYSTPELEAMAAESDQFWYIRKLVWLNTRKSLEKHGVVESRQLGTYFTEPMRDWTTAQLVARDDTPDLIFRSRRLPSDPPPIVLEANASDLSGLITALPVAWRKGEGLPPTIHWQIPAVFRGKFARVEIHAASPQIEALTIHLDFLHSGKERAEYLLKPYLHREPQVDFFEFEIPADATDCVVELRIASSTKSIRFTGFRTFLENAPRKAD